MDLKKDLDISSGDFWYDISRGGYIDPYKMCVKKEDAEKVRDAVKILADFEQSCEEQIDGFVL